MIYDHAISYEDGTPVLLVIEACGDGKIIMAPAKDQPPREELMLIIEAQGGLHRPHGIFRYDPDLARSGIRNCPECGSLIQNRYFARDPLLVPVKCCRCQAPMRAKRTP